MTPQRYTVGTTGGSNQSSQNFSGTPNIRTSIVVEESVDDLSGSKKLIPGDLGQLFVSDDRAELLKTSLRLGGTNFGLSSPNMKYKGFREGNKFNLVIQKAVSVITEIFSTTKTWYNSLQPFEFSIGPAQSSIPTNSEISLIYHIRSQIEFKEWLLLSKNGGPQWFV